MRRAFLFLVIPAVLLLDCQPQTGPDRQREWRDVLRYKRAAVAPAATARQKQVYADSISAFVQRHPTHSRAREVYLRMQLEFADELFAIGRYQDAIRFYRAILSRDGSNEPARRGLSAALDRLAVSREKLLRLQKGMSQRQVAQILGRPVPGWTVAKRRPGALSEAWYYRTTSGGVAGVYFRDGKVFAAEENSQAKIGL